MSAPGACMRIISQRHREDGYGTPNNPEKFLNQDYKQLKEIFLVRNMRYIDDTFPPDSRSIGEGILSPSLMAQVKWQRPWKFVPNAAFVVDGVSRFDFGQGMVGDCWFLASIGSLTFQANILNQVVPLEQSFDDDYCGLFHFRFWRFGRWIDVVIDDNLPTINDRLIFVRSKDPTEFWPALMEKAYAKVCGSYADMNAGSPAEALVDFTGGVHICVELSDLPADLWQLMCRAGRSKSLMSCGTPQGETAENTVLPNGLVQCHAYTVTGVKEMKSTEETVQLVRLWNPWGKREWNGDWSDESPLWKTVSTEERQQCLSICDDGEFWMTLKDFCRNFSDLDICSSNPDFLEEGSACNWRTSFFEGRWVAGTTAGGCMNHLESFWTNPQYRVQVEKLNSQCAQNQGEKNMLVSLMQKPDKRNRRMVQNLHIGFSIFEVTGENKAQRGKFPDYFFQRNTPVAQSKITNARDVMEFVSLKPGEYLIVPSTYKPNETASFILTIISKAETHVQESSGVYHQKSEETKKLKPGEDNKDDEKKITLFRQNSDKYEEVDAEKLQILLNDKILTGDLKFGGFSTDACRSMVALMDTSVTGKLNSDEFVRLWKNVVKFKEIFYKCDVSQTGTLSLKELRNAFVVAGRGISDEILNLIALRYGASSGHITLENFINLILRFDCMAQIYKQLSSGNGMVLREQEWMYLSMYT